MYVDPDDVIETHPKIVALRAQLAQVTQERDILKVKHADLMKWYDTMFGTPCEEIRHQQQIEKLEEELAQAQQRAVELWSACNLALSIFVNQEYIDKFPVLYTELKAALTPLPPSTHPTRSDRSEHDLQQLREHHYQAGLRDGEALGRKAALVAVWDKIIEISEPDGPTLEEQTRQFNEWLTQALAEGRKG